MNESTKLLILGLGLSVALAGCAGSSNGVEYYPVSGKLLVDGKPAAGVAIQFVPEGGIAGGVSVGVTDEAGTYVLQSVHGGTGAAAGRYRVCLQKWAQPDGSPIPEGKTAADVSAVNRMPQGYADPSTTPLSAEVKASDEGNTIDFEASSTFVAPPF